MPNNGSRLAVVFRLLHRFHIEFGGDIRRCDGVYCPAYETLDHESHPVHLTWSVFSYIPWLILEIIKADLDVAKRVILGGSSIDPAVLEVKSTQKTELGQVIFANSITLTPGTTTMRIEDDTLLIHTVAREVGEDLLKGDMDRRVTRMEGHG